MLYAFCLKQKPLQTSEKRLTAVVLAPPARLELTTFRLGGGPSIPVRYGGLYNKYSIFGLNRIRTNCRLGGGRSIQLSYSDRYGFPQKEADLFYRRLPILSIGKRKNIHTGRRKTPLTDFRTTQHLTAAPKKPILTGEKLFPNYARGTVRGDGQKGWPL